MDGEKGQCWGQKRCLCSQESAQTEVEHVAVCWSSRGVWGLPPCPMPCLLLLSWPDQGLWLEVCPGWGSVLEESREGLGDALENAAHTSCCKWSIHHGASWLVCCAAVLVPPPDMESCAVSGLKIEEAPKYTP